MADNININAYDSMSTITLQNYAGTINLTTKILYDEKFAITFNSENCKYVFMYKYLHFIITLNKIEIVSLGKSPKLT